MKKLIVLVLAVVMSLGIVGVSLGEESTDTVEVSEKVASIDLSSMDLDELVALKKLISNEIDARIGFVDRFYSGFFVGGQDIKTGSYILTQTLDSDRYGHVYLYKDMEDYEENEGYPYEAQYFKAQGESCMIVVNEGTVITLEGFEGTIERVGASEWAP